MATQFIAILAAAGLASAGVTAASETRSAGALPESTVNLMAQDDAGGGGQKCRVEVVRSGAGGTASVNSRDGFRFLCLHHYHRPGWQQRRGRRRRCGIAARPGM